MWSVVGSVWYDGEEGQGERCQRPRRAEDMMALAVGAAAVAEVLEEELGS